MKFKSEAIALTMLWGVLAALVWYLYYWPAQVYIEDKSLEERIGQIDQNLEQINQVQVIRENKLREAISLIGTGNDQKVAQVLSQVQAAEKSMSGQLVVYGKHAGNSDCLKTRYDQPVDHYRGGADECDPTWYLLSS